jgi:hypothetical protein
MKVKSIIFLRHDSSEITSWAVIDVPGLGEVKIEKCFSEETINRMCGEAILTLQRKMGEIK